VSESANNMFEESRNGSWFCSVHTSLLFDQPEVRQRMIFVTTLMYLINAVIVEFGRTTVFRAFTQLPTTNYTND
jgi:hypothetical protein